MRVILYTGKGGVGKSTIAAATALRAAELGQRVLVLSADAAHSLGDVLERRLGPEPIAVAPRLDALEVDGTVEMVRRFARVHAYLLELFRHQGVEDLVAEELALLPGAEELATLLAMETWAQSGRYDLVVVDCAPTDSALRLLTLPEVARAGLRTLLRLQRGIAAIASPLASRVIATPLPDAGVFDDVERVVYRELRQLRRRVTAELTSVRLVVTSERMVVDEAARAYTDLCLFDLPCDAVVMNRMLPDAAIAEGFFLEWGRRQAERRLDVEARFAPLRILEAPLLPEEAVGIENLGHLGRALFEGVLPHARLSEAPRVRFTSTDAGYRVALPLPGVDEGALSVAVVGGELCVRAGARRRALALPRRLRSAHLARARLVDSVLLVDFERRRAARERGAAVLVERASAGTVA